MSSSSNPIRKRSGIVWVVVFICLAMLLRNLLWLAPAFLYCGFALHKSNAGRGLRVTGIVACIVLALAAIGLQLGTDAALRDNRVDQRTHTLQDL